MRILFSGSLPRSIFSRPGSNPAVCIEFEIMNQNIFAQVGSNPPPWNSDPVCFHNINCGMQVEEMLIYSINLHLLPLGGSQPPWGSIWGGPVLAQNSQIHQHHHHHKAEKFFQIWIPHPFPSEILPIFQQFFVSWISNVCSQLSRNIFIKLEKNPAF